MLRTLIFGAIAAYVGKKLYDDGTLSGFRDDLARRLSPGDASAPVPGGVAVPSGSAAAPASAPTTH
ncbi:MAG: hypothetical protein DI547_04130 [Sphingobium sp.]|nr:MAG: hypothetical protein DI547_04130 [Sphingobium sp.]